MELKLESGLDHQILAVDAICDVFRNVGIAYEVGNYSNPIINLSANYLERNIEAIQRRDTQNVGLKFRNYKAIDNTLCLDIKMETGTGKTYVYTHTIFELHKFYGINKFIIAVPSIPIKAGTGAFLNETYARAHFKNTLGYDAEISVGVLEAEKKQKKGRKYFPSVVRNFVEGSRQNTNKIYVLLVNRSLLTNGKMLTRNDYDVTVADYARPFDALRATRPFVIIDEPHTFSRDQKAYKVIMQELAPQCIIRFGATFPMTTVGKGKKKMTVRDYEHLLYDLNAQRSFSSNLIKGVMKEHFEPATNSNEKVKLLSIEDKKTATFQYISQTSKVSHTLGINDSLSILSSDLAGLTIAGMTQDTVTLSNGMEKRKGEEFCVDIYSSSYQESMMRLAIQRHFETERENFGREKGRIKTLALFFIDDIVSFRGDEQGNGAWLREKFDSLLTSQLKAELRKDNSEEYEAYLKASLKDIAACRAGYFSQDNSDSDEAVKKEVDDILRNKTELLSITGKDGKYNTRRFLFSKWTLKEGWDNPNVFTICKLRSSGSENSKLQEVGRGLRLPVDEFGNRVKGDSFYLNYIVDFTERDFADRLVKEINEDERTGLATNIPKSERERVAALRGIDEMTLFIELLTKHYIDTEGKILDGKAMDLFAEYPEFNNVTGKVKDRNKGSRDMVKIRKAQYNELKELWAQLNRKYIVFYQQGIDEQIAEALPEILAEEVFVHNTIRSKRQKVTAEEGEAVSVQQVGQSYVLTGKEMRYNEFLKRACRQTSIPMTMLHDAICEYAKTHSLDGYINESSLSAFIAKFSGWKVKNLQNLVKYRQANYSSQSTAFTNADGSLKDEVLQWTIGKNVLSAEPSPKYLYDKVVYDSPLERENIMSEVDRVIVYGKIPQKSICIPNITNDLYSPDFMYVVEHKDGKKELNVVIETKDVPYDEAKRTVEDAKIENARLFFEQLKLDGYEVKFCRQLQNKKMANIISELLEE